MIQIIINNTFYLKLSQYNFNLNKNALYFRL